MSMQHAVFFITLQSHFFLLIKAYFKQYYIFICVIATANIEILNQILEKITTTLAYVKKIDEKIDKASFMIQNNLMAVNDDLINLFPMKDIESVQQVDKKFSLDREFEIQMVISHQLFF